jgi:hypothetical protein
MSEQEQDLGRAAHARSRWPWLSLLPIGFGAWAPIYAGVRARVASWIALGALWSAIAVTGWVMATGSDSHGHHKTSDAAGLLMIFAWVGGAATSFVIRADYERRMGSPMLVASEHARERLREREQARELAMHDPKLAREMGIGRPDTPGAPGAGLVDVNNAAAATIATLPGIDGDLATRIVEARAQIDGFSSLEDLGLTLDLPGDLVERLRDRVVFLPR